MFDIFFKGLFNLDVRLMGERFILGLFVEDFFELTRGCFMEEQFDGQ